MVPRARIGLATPAFSGPRSTGELPRHRCIKQFYGKFGGLTNENGVRWEGSFRLMRLSVAAEFKRFTQRTRRKGGGELEKDRGDCRRGAEGAEKGGSKRVPGSIKLNRPLQIQRHWHRFAKITQGKQDDDTSRIVSSCRCYCCWKRSWVVFLFCRFLPSALPRIPW